MTHVPPGDGKQPHSPVIAHGNNGAQEPAPPSSALASSTASVAHNLEMAREFLAALDPTATKFTFQFIGDTRKGHAETFHGTLDEAWRKVELVNNEQGQVGVFVTINETNLKGRKSDDILRCRSLFVDADGERQVQGCEKALADCGITPSAVVRTGRGSHYYFFGDVPRSAFSDYQQRLIKRLGTDTSIRDLPRVMRLSGTLHLKNPSKPHLVTLEPSVGLRPRFVPDTLMSALGASTSLQTDSPSASSVLSRQIAGPVMIASGGPASPPTSCLSPLWTPPDQIADFTRIDLVVQQVFRNATDRLSDGLEADVEEIRSAALAIPRSALASENDWVRVARGIASEAAIFPASTERLYAILDEVSRRAPGYDEDENRRRWDRYKDEAFDRENPITIATVFAIAKKHGWPGHVQCAGSTPSPVQRGASVQRAVPVSRLPLVPPKRKWLHGTDLVRGAVTVLYAPGGRAKSSWLLGCGLACASGRPLLGSHVFGGPLRVLCLSTEDGLSEMALRIRAAMKHHGLADADVPGLFLIGADGWGLSLLQADRNRAVLNSTGLEALSAELDHIKPDVLIIDPLINLMGGVNGNDNSAAAMLMGHLASLAATRQISIALAHHASKGRDINSAESAMGAATYINLARVALSIEPLEEKHAGSIGVPSWDAKFYFRVNGTKQNFSPPSVQDRWFRLASIDMLNSEPPVYVNGDQVAVVEPYKPGVSSTAFPPDLIRDALLVIDGASPPLSPSTKSPDRYAAPMIAQAIAGHRGGQVSEVEGKAVLDHLTKTRLVDVADIKVFRPGKGSDVRKGLVLTPAGYLAVREAEQSRAPNPLPQSPQSPAIPSAGNAVDAGGDQPRGSPATQGGCGGNAGGDNAGGEPISHAVRKSVPRTRARRRSGSRPVMRVSEPHPMTGTSATPPVNDTTGARAGTGIISSLGEPDGLS